VLQSTTEDGLDPRTEDLRIVVGAATDVGGRDRNEDAVHIGPVPPVADAAAQSAPESYLLAVADGMGGHERGDEASRLAIEILQSAFAADPGADAALLMKQAFRRANQAIFESRNASGADQMMGTTLVAALLRGKYATIASIGDSRAYLVRAGLVTQVTKDHSLVAQQVDQGEISAEDARESPHRNVLIHALGHRERLDAKMPNVFELSLLPEDRLFLCSDGFSDVVKDQEIVAVALEGDPELSSRRLVDLALEHGASDNVSAIVAEAVPTRVSLVPELVGAPAGRDGASSYLVPAIVSLAVVLFIVLVVLALMVL